MITILFILSVILLATFIYLGIKTSDDSYWQDGWIAVVCVTSIVLIILTISLVVLSVGVVREKSIDDKITMYQDENANIENSIQLCIDNFQHYEAEVYANAKTSDVVTLVQLYPEIKSDTLVQKQMDIYVDNNQKIKKLKEDKIDIQPMKWWLYFGK